MGDAASKRWVIALVAVWGGAVLMVGVLAAVLLWRVHKNSVDHSPKPAHTEQRRPAIVIPKEPEALPEQNPDRDFVAEAVAQRKMYGAGSFSYWPDRVKDRRFFALKSGKVLQVIGPTDMLVEWSSKTAWVTGVATDGIIDGQRLSTHHILVVAGTKTYGTANGATRTVHVLQAIPEEFSYRITDKFKAMDYEDEARRNAEKLKALREDTTLPSRE